MITCVFEYSNGRRQLLHFEKEELDRIIENNGIYILEGRKLRYVPELFEENNGQEDINR